MYILSWRSDALTERLNSILNGIYLAKLLNLEFRFTWPDFIDDSTHHVIPNSPWDLFSAAFMHAHYVKEKQVSIPTGFDIDDQRQRRSQMLRTNHSSPKFRKLSERGFDFFLAPLRRPESVTRETLFVESVNIFKNQMFTSAVRESLDMAGALKIEPGTTAIHFRCGDVIYGKARFWGRFARDKSLCLPVARHLLMQTDPDRGKILFGGSQKDLNLLRGGVGKHVLANEKLAGIANGSAGLLAEVILMSRCGRLFCSGGSGVTNLAKAIGNVEALDVRALLSVEEEYRIIREFLSITGSDDLHRAFAAYNAFILSWESGRRESLDHYIGIASRCDPENPLYPALSMLLAMREENFQAFSEARFRLEGLWTQELRHEDCASRYLRFIKHKNNNGTPVVPELIAEIRAQYPGGGGLKRSLDFWLQRR